MGKTSYKIINTNFNESWIKIIKYSKCPWVKFSYDIILMQVPLLQLYIGQNKISIS